MLLSLDAGIMWLTDTVKSAAKKITPNVISDFQTNSSSSTTFQMARIDTVVATKMHKSDTAKQTRLIALGMRLC